MNFIQYSPYSFLLRISVWVDGKGCIGHKNPVRRKRQKANSKFINNVGKTFLDKMNYFKYS